MCSGLILGQVLSLPSGGGSSPSPWSPHSLKPHPGVPLFLKYTSICGTTRAQAYPYKRLSLSHTQPTYKHARIFTYFHSHPHITHKPLPLALFTIDLPLSLHLLQGKQLVPGPSSLGNDPGSSCLLQALCMPVPRQVPSPEPCSWGYCLLLPLALFTPQGSLPGWLCPLSGRAVAAWVTPLF